MTQVVSRSVLFHPPPRHCQSESSEAKTAEAIEKKSQTLPQCSIIDLHCNYLPPWQNKPQSPSQEGDAHVAT